MTDKLPPYAAANIGQKMGEEQSDNMNLTPFLKQKSGMIEAKENGCMVWKIKTKGRGHKYGVTRANGQRTYAHRASYEAAYGPIPDGMIVRHRCDTPRCVNPAHLCLGTHKDNTKDMIARRRAAWQKPGFPRGEASSKAKLRELDVIRLRCRKWKPREFSKLAREYGVTPQSLRAAITGATWQHVRQAPARVGSTGAQALPQ